MPPKKDDKKGGKSGKTKAPPKEIDPNLYRRQPVVFEELKDVPNHVNSGFVIDVKNLFPEWDVSAEDWTAAVENEAEIVFPSHIRPAAYKSLKALLVKEVEDPTAVAGKGGKKEAPKKGAAPVATDLQEAIRDVAGNLLPRVFLDQNFDTQTSTDMEIGFQGKMQSWPFLRVFTEEQVLLRQTIEEEAALIAQEAAESGGAAAEDLLPTFKESPSGLPRDPLVCKAFELSQRMASEVAGGDGDDNFLWNAIWPKQPNGRPCFNPAGKYCVRLFLAGAWRKVTVSDVIPVDENGYPLLASSIQPLELWPMILSKAIHKVYAACGYVQTAGEFGISSGVFNSVDVGRFVAFAISLLNGVAPSALYHMQSAVRDHSVLAQYFNEVMTSGFTAVVHPDEAPGEDPTKELKLQMEDNIDMDVRNTKKNFIREYQWEDAEQRKVLGLVGDWEAKVANLASQLASAQGESFFVSISTPWNPNELAVYPILAISTGASSFTGEEPDFLAVQVLLDWKITPGEINPTSFPPKTTNLLQKWKTIEEIIQCGGILFSIQSKSAIKYTHCFDWKWVKPDAPAEVIDPKAKGGKAAPKKGETVVAEPVGPVEVFDQGIPPALLLNIEKTAENESFEETVFLNVTIHADLTFSSSPEPLTVGKIVDDVVIILQEISLDEEGSESKGCDLLRLELSKENPLPFISRSFRLKIPSSANKVFWLRIFSKSSISLQFSCNRKISLGNPEEIWPIIFDGASNTCLVKAGQVPAIRKGIEHIVLRISLGSSEATNATCFLSISNRNVAKCASLVLIDSSKKSSRVLDRSCGSLIQIEGGIPYILVARVYSKSTDLPSFNYKFVTVSQRPLAEPKYQFFELPAVRYKGFYSPNNKLCLFRDQVALDKSHLPLAIKMSLSGLKMEDGSEIPIHIPPSNRIVADDDSLQENTAFVLRIIRKIDKFVLLEVFARGVAQIYDITIDDIMRDLPAGVSVITAAAPVAAGKDAKKDAKKDPKKETVDASGPAPPVPASGEKIELIIECVIDENNMNVPSSLRSRYPFVFDDINSKIPESVAEGSSVCKIRKPTRSFEWNLDVLGGFLTEVLHDTDELLQFAALKNSWEDASEGRSERALAAYNYYLEKSALVKTEPVPDANKSATESLLANLCNALETEVDAVKEKENESLNVVQYKECVTGLDLPRELVSEEDAAADLAYLDAETERFNALSNATKERFQALNVMLQEVTLTRVNELFEASKTYLQENKDKWKLREEYKAVVESRNKSLQYLLERAADARLEFNEDGTRNEAKGKDAKGKKK